MLYFLIVLMVGLDQRIKYIISQQFDLHQIQSVIPSFFSITYYHNTGGAFSFLAEKSWGIILLSSISFVVSIVLMFFIIRLRKQDVFWIRFALTLLVSGTIGNMIDRIRTGAVIDYLMFTFGPYTFPIFNLADICIVMGSFLLAIFMIGDKKLFQNEKTEDIHPSTVHLDIQEGKSPSNDI